MARPAQYVGRLVVEADDRRPPRGRLRSRSAVTGDAGGAQGSREAEEQAVLGAGAARAVIAVSITSSGPLARTRSASSRYLTATPERGGRRSRCRARGAERVEGAGPVERLGDARWLEQVVAVGPQPLGERGRPARRGPWRPRARTAADDRQLALEARVVDPVVEAAALEGVVELAGAVRGEDDDRRRGRRAPCRARGWSPARSRAPRAGTPRTRRRPGRPRRRAARRAPPAGPAAPAGRAGSARRTGPCSTSRTSCAAPSAPPRPPAGAGSGAGSPSRTGPGWRRCPRSTAAG